MMEALWAIQLKFTNFTGTMIDVTWPMFRTESECERFRPMLVELLKQNGAHDFVISVCTYVGS